MRERVLKGFGQDILEAPRGIAVTEDNVFVTDESLHSLLQFRKKDCKLVRRTGTKGAGEGHLDFPRGLSSDYNRDVYVADARNNRVCLETTPIQEMSRYSTVKLSCRCESDSKQLSSPRRESKLYPLLFEELLRSCVTQGADDMVYRPRFFCLDTADILITNIERHNVKILSPSGHLIHMVGKEGDGRGEFEYQFGICLSELGTISVVSWNCNFTIILICSCLFQ